MFNLIIFSAKFSYFIFEMSFEIEHQPKLARKIFSSLVDVTSHLQYLNVETFFCMLKGPCIFEVI